jgi:hypothetical protein
MEVWYWLLTYWPYQLMRAVTALYINDSSARKVAVENLARKNAIRLLEIEKWLGMDIEKGTQQFILKKMPKVMGWLSNVYLAHITVGVFFLGYAFT